MVGMRWVLVPRNQETISSYWRSEIASHRLQVGQSGLKTDLPAVIEALPASNFANFIGLLILSIYVLGVLLSLGGRIFNYLATQYEFGSTGNSIYFSKNLTPESKSWYFSAHYINKRLLPDLLVIFFPFVAIPLMVLEYLAYDVVEFYKRGALWFTELRLYQY